MGLSVTIALIGATVLVSWLAFNNPRLLDRLILWPPAIERQRQYDRLLTHGFIHADFQHLLFNMLTLFFFGRPVESEFAGHGLGALVFLGFYLSAIVVAILPSYMRHRGDARYRSLGASGAVSAVMFSFILFSPWSKIYLFIFPVGVPAVVYAVCYVAYSIWMDRRGGDNVNHSAHLVGGAYGVAFTLLAMPDALNEFLSQLGVPA